MEARLDKLEAKVQEADVRIAVSEDRIERTHRDIDRFFVLLDKHMREEEVEREKDRLNGKKNFSDLYTMINEIRTAGANRKGFAAGIVAAVSVFWVLAAFVAKVAGWI